MAEEKLFTKDVAEFTDVISKVNHTINVIGIKETINSLDKAKILGIFKTKDNAINHVLDCVCEVMSINRDELLLNNNRTEEKKIAWALIVYHCKNTLKLEIEEVWFFFDKRVLIRQFYKQYALVKNTNMKQPKSVFEKRIKECFEHSLEKINIDNYGKKRK